MPSYQEITTYRATHLSPQAQRKVEALLAQRRTDKVEADNDIIIDRRVFPWNWANREGAIRSKVFEVIYGADVCWEEEQDFRLQQKIIAEEKTILPCEGWLLIENRQVVGAAEFKVTKTSTQPYPWLWLWIFIDPEHRRKGIASKRVPIWFERYGDFLIDQPNEQAFAMLEKTGYLGRLTIKAESRPIAKGVTTANTYKYLGPDAPAKA